MIMRSLASVITLTVAAFAQTSILQITSGVGLGSDYGVDVANVGRVDADLVDDYIVGEPSALAARVISGASGATLHAGDRTPLVPAFTKSVRAPTAGCGAAPCR